MTDQLLQILKKEKMVDFIQKKIFFLWTFFFICCNAREIAIICCSLVQPFLTSLENVFYADFLFASLKA